MNEEPFAVLPPDKNETTSAAVKPSILTWLPRLYFSPTEFFRENIFHSPLLLVIFCAFVMGLVGGMSYYMNPANLPESPEHNTSGAYVFGLILGRAAIISLVWYFLAGSWYGLRLSFCQSPSQEWKLARRTFIFTEMIYGLPLAIGLGIWWIEPSRPILLATAFIGGMLAFWSLYVSYCGARILFQTTRTRTIIWFIVVPAIFYGFIIAFPFVKRDAESHLAEIKTPFENPTIKMECPANWIRMEGNFPKDVAVFHIPDIGGFAIAIKDSQGGEVDLKQAAEIGANLMAKNLKITASNFSVFTTWGDYQGYGVRFSFKLKGNNSFGRVFCTTLPDGRILMVEESGLASSATELDKQYQIVRNSLVVKPIKQRH